eukprot:Rmarinus@m.7156
MRKSRKLSHDTEPSQASQSMSPDMSQMTQQTQAALKNVGSAEKEALISSVMRLLLFRTSNRLPCKREDFMKYAVPKERSRILRGLLEEARLRFPDYGYKLIEDQAPKAAMGMTQMSQASQSSGGQKLYYLVSTLDPEVAMEFEPKQSSAFCALRMTITTLITFSENGIMDEDMLLDQLAKLGLHVRDEIDHPIFGDVQILLDDMVRQRYLVREKIKQEDEFESTSTKYKVGPRISKEVSADDFLEFAMEICGHNNISEQSKKELKRKWERRGLDDDEDDEDE